MWLRAGFLLLIAFGLFLLVIPKAQASPLYKTDQADFSITLYTDSCKMTEVTNLPWRAVWVQDGKEVEGCWAGWNAFGVVAAYFADKTVAVIPMGVFEKVMGV